MVIHLSRETLSPYLSSLLGSEVRILNVAPLGVPKEGEGRKQYGYGIPLLIEFERSGEVKRVVLETVKPGPFGHEHMADRAQALLWSHPAYNDLPRHVRSLDVGAISRSRGLVSVGDAEEFFILTEFAPGEGYFRDLERLRDADRAEEADLRRADALCDYLAGIHSRRGPDPGLYVRRVRELLGHGECIMGLTDSYPPRHGFITAELLEKIERRCLAWRWKLKGRSHRLRQVHGDFHPWNVLFTDGANFAVLDRSRGEWGEPADDVTCLTLNYIFFSLQRSGDLRGGLELLFRRFWDRYLAASGDSEILEVAAPFFAFRALVMASPVWYPQLDEGVRRRLFRFMENVLEAERFEPDRVNACL